MKEFLKNILTLILMGLGIIGLFYIAILYVAVIILLGGHIPI